MKFQKPKGTEDYYPEDCIIKEKIFDSFRKTARQFNFNEVSSPAFESLKLLSEKEGEEIKGQIFTFERRSDEQLGLKFDLTVPMTRMFIEKQKVLQKPVKWFSIDRMWRYEKPQKGRLREFYQISCEIFGGKNTDIEILSLAIQMLNDLGLKDDYIVKVNDRRILEKIVRKYTDKVDDMFRIIDKKSKITKEEFTEELKKIGVNDVENLEKDLSEEPMELLPLKKLSKDIIIDLTIARGLSYYTGVVFEIFDKKGKYRALCGGGAYDNLVEMFGGQPCSATGFAIGLSTLTLLLRDKGKLPVYDLSPEYFIACVDESCREETEKIASKLRKKTSVEIDLTGRNIGNQMKYASYIGAKKVIVIGPEEIKKNKFKVKDMKSGKETDF